MKISNELQYQRAIEKVKALRGFYGNLVAYCIVIPLLAYINLGYSADFLWFLFPAIGWGIGLLGNAMQAYGYHPLWGKNWEERKIQEFMANDNF